MTVTRRAAIASAAALAASAARAALPSYALPPGPAPTAADQPTQEVPPTAAGKYRQDQPRLFQACAQPLLPSTIPGAGSLNLDTVGPTWLYVSPQCGWEWTRPGGDWLDADGVRHGAKAWGSVRTDPAPGGARTRTRYSIDATALVNHCVATGRWLALMLRCAAARDIAGNGSADRPQLLLHHADRSTTAVPLWVAAGIAPSSKGPATHGEVLSLPCLLEWPRPAAPVLRAEIVFTVVVHWSGADTAVGAFLADPPMNTEPVQRGVELAAELHDDGLAAAPGIIGTLRLADGTTTADIRFDSPHAYSNEEFFSRHLFDPVAPRDLTRPPFVQGNRFAGLHPNNARVVPSTYRGEGFLPVAPGIGALRVHMPAEAWTPDTLVGSTGSTATTSIIFLPDNHIGRLRRIFTRYYFRLGTPYAPRYADTRQQLQGPAQANWTTNAGKFGFGPEGTSSWGGVSGTSGGRAGWQMRASWYDCPEESGPETGGIAAGFHLFDFRERNPAGHRYGGIDWPANAERWGPLGGMLYAGHWYCITTELDLNTMMDAAPGYKADGALRMWIDGRLCWSRDGMVFRTGPVLRPPPTLYAVRPVRELGVRGQWLDIFHGGKTWSLYPRTHFYACMAWGTQYIGPMKLQAA